MSWSATANSSGGTGFPGSWGMESLSSCVYGRTFISLPGGAKSGRPYASFTDCVRAEFRQLDKRRGCGVKMRVRGFRTSTGEPLILACHGIEGAAATQAYMRRWNIETGFGKLKTHGFHMESSRPRSDGKMEPLLAALAIAMAWSYSCGAWSEKHIASINLKKHGRPEHSVFARGLMPLGDLPHGFAKDSRRVSLAVFGILRAAVAAQEK